jgi:hypothetical protein
MDEMVDSFGIEKLQGSFSRVERAEEEREHEETDIWSRRHNGHSLSFFSLKSEKSIL